ncbi:MAG: penicillin-binding protein [Rhodobacteraceae bacterium]|nr:penicillin-binding protein [Paracoccaceae bacterium]
MARKKRIEPQFTRKPDASAVDIRPGERDRTAGPARSSKPKRKPASERPKTRKSSAKTASKRAPAKAGKGGGRGKSRRKFNRGGLIGGLTWLARKLFYWGLVAGVWGGIIAAGVVIYYAAYLPPTSEWSVPQRPPNVKIVSQSGELLGNRGDTGGEAVRLEQLPSYLPNAVISIEDRRFRSHVGFDPIGLTRAVITNFTSGTVRQGGSTLSQQLAKNLFLEPDRTVKRKIQELILAIWLEAKFSKDQILEMYLNRVYLGSGAYGVDAASRRYFGKPARLVTIAEAATLAGLLKAPSRLSPLRNPDLAEERAKLVITAMHDEGYITAQEALDAISAPAKVVRRHTTASQNYAADWVMDMLPHYVGSFDKDIIVDTTIDVPMQLAAENALRKALKENKVERRVSQGAVVTLDTAGAVRALVGGADYSRSQFNRAVYAKRQPGSAFKPFVFLTALEKGMTPNTVRQDKPVTLNGWSPNNYTKKHYGNVTLTKALAMSLNTVAAQLAYEVGPKAIAKTAHRLGIQSKLTSNLTLSLGTSEVTPLEIVGAYVPFSNGGYGVLPHIIRRIRTMDGETLYSRQGDGLGRVIDRDLVAEMNQMMAETLLTGTGKRALMEDLRPAAGKTGTSQDSRDAWFIGYTANLTTGVWLGNDDNSPTKKVTGGNLPAMVWKEVMDAEHQDIPVANLPGVLNYGQVLTPPAPKSTGPQVNRDDPGALVPPEPLGEGKGPLDLLKSIFGG